LTSCETLTKLELRVFVAELSALDDARKCQLSQFARPSLPLYDKANCGRMTRKSS
jgi:hypothetical protein